MYGRQIINVQVSIEGTKPTINALKVGDRSASGFKKSHSCIRDSECVKVEINVIGTSQKMTRRNVKMLTIKKRLKRDDEVKLRTKGYRSLA